MDAKDKFYHHENIKTNSQLEADTMVEYHVPSIGSYVIIHKGPNEKEYIRFGNGRWGWLDANVTNSSRYVGQVTRYRGNGRHVEIAKIMPAKPGDEKYFEVDDIFGIHVKKIYVTEPVRLFKCGYIIYVATKMPYIGHFLKADRQKTEYQRQTCLFEGLSFDNADIKEIIIPG